MLFKISLKNISKKKKLKKVLFNLFYGLILYSNFTISYFSFQIIIMTTLMVGKTSDQDLSKKEYIFDTCPFFYKIH